jgi:hypothetical protein
MTSLSGVTAPHPGRYRPRCVHRLVMPLVMMTLAASPANAQMFVPTGRDTLRGLPGVEVVVEELQPELVRGGLSAAAIRDDVERRLRAHGIVVYASHGENASPAKPYLYLHLNTLPLPGHAAYVVGLQVHLRQTLRSGVTGSNIVNAMTWDAHNVLAVPAGSLGAVRDEILDYVDLFIKDWLAAHPESAWTDPTGVREGAVRPSHE